MVLSHSGVSRKKQPHVSEGTDHFCPAMHQLDSSSPRLRLSRYREEQQKPLQVTFML